jgi:chemotaxis protein MotB
MSGEDDKTAKPGKEEKPEKKKETQEMNAIVRPRRFQRHIGETQGSSQSTWLISFTDVMALMLTFFVLLFAMSNPDAEKWEKLSENMQENFLTFEGEKANRGAQDDISIARVDYNRALNLNYLKALIENLMAREDGSLEDLTIMQSGNQLILSLPQEVLFETGGTALKPDATDTLYTLVNALRRVKNRIEVVGHADPRPTSGGQYASNWELSLARAATVAGLMENVGYDRPLAIKGYASGRYYDLPADKFSEEQRMDLSRRVDLIIREDDGTQFRLFDLNLPAISGG